MIERLNGKPDSKKTLLKVVTIIIFLLSPIFLFLSFKFFFLYLGLSLIFLLSLSYLIDASLPFIGEYLEKRYFANFLKMISCERSGSAINKIKFYFYHFNNFIYSYLIILCKSSKGSFRIIREKLYVFFDKYVNKKHTDDYKYFKAKEIIDKMKREEKLTVDQIDELENIIYQFYLNLRKRIAIFSLSGLTLVILSVSIVSFITVLVFPNVNETGAASYTYTQTDWSGGIDATAEAVHPTDQSSWNKFQSGGGVDASNGELKLERTISIN